MQRLGNARIKGRRYPGAWALAAAVLIPVWAFAGEGPRTAAMAPTDAPAPEVAVPLETLAATIAAWVSEALGTPLPAEMPRIRQLDAVDMMTMLHGAEAGANRHVALRIVALYDDDTQTIYLPEGWTGSTPAELSVLVHEMVHHEQNLSGRSFACPSAREAEAFDLQERWLGLFGTALEAEFELNLLHRLILTRCSIH